MSVYFEKVTVLGVGLLGASIARAMKARAMCGSVTGYGRSIRNLEEAVSLGIIDEFRTSAEQACEEADLVVLSSPPAVFNSLVSSVKNSLKSGALVTDVGSVKGSMVSEIESLMPSGAHYVGSHPIAGSEKSGIADSNADLFDSALCIVTPTAKTDKDALKKITGLWVGVGAVVEIMDPFRHDEVYAAVSHFPHLLAYELVNTVAEADPGHLKYAGQGFRDTTRIAMSSPELWRDICMLNSEELIKLIAVFRKRLDSMEERLRNKEAGRIEAEFIKAAGVRKSMNPASRSHHGE
ncbi:MAG: prephenate dehydrogenase/arogenate dehydrogenase family protein [Nitrospiraceae bacterium]|nr:prephenate dehydrogenase/arogenate dehydrogenase family protein [Nitrospiraceae bacterium]